MCVETCGLDMWCCKTHCNGCMTVAWGLFWGGGRSTKPCVFPCKVAAGGDEGYLVCAAVAATIVPGANWFSLDVLQRVAVHVRSYRVFWNLCLWLLLRFVAMCVETCDAAKSIVMVAASRFLAAAAVCLILSFAAERRESYSSRCIKVALVICQ